MNSYNSPQDSHEEAPLHLFLRDLVIDDESVFRLTQRFSKLYRELAANSLEQFFPTPVTCFPTGKERGRFLAGYVGLCSLRVAFIDLLGEYVPPGNPKKQNVRRTLEKAWRIDNHMKRDNAKDLFGWIGDCVAEVVADGLHGSDGNPAELDIGISFCFPLKCAKPSAQPGFAANF